MDSCNWRIIMTYKLLLIDDEKGLCKSLKLYLENQGFTVDTAYNVELGWKLLSRNLYNLVISDIMMPDIDGYEFLSQLRNKPRLKSLPIILLTAKGLSQDRIKAYKGGCNAYLSKPFNPEELLSIINNLLRQFDNIIEKPIKTETQKQSREYNNLFKEKTFIFNKVELSCKEQYILNLIIQGSMNKEIAQMLSTGLRNVEKYVSQLLYKTNTHNRAQLVRYIISNNLYI
uniref:Regulatory component of sensory transduction system n=1 Tax=Gronococcus sybilensis TaxID=3028029 RepID=A0A9Y1MXL9_9RHOD|nr:regulatory component of sensory transduction system [Gronococcus sybilensis]